VRLNCDSVTPAIGRGVVP